jgi:hypothetical protein
MLQEVARRSSSRVKSPRRFGRDAFEIPQPSRNIRNNDAALGDSRIPKCVGTLVLLSAAAF